MVHTELKIRDYPRRAAVLVRAGGFFSQLGQSFGPALLYALIPTSKLAHKAG